MNQSNEINFYNIAKLGYEAYGRVTGNKNYQGLPMPEFDALTDTIKAAWVAAAQEISKVYVDATLI